MRFFDTEGPVRPDDHYGIPPLARMDVEELPGPIRGIRAHDGSSRATPAMTMRSRAGTAALPPSSRA